MLEEIIWDYTYERFFLLAVYTKDKDSSFASNAAVRMAMRVSNKDAM